MALDRRTLFTLLVAIGSVATAHAIAPDNPAPDRAATTNPAQAASVELSPELKAKYRRPDAIPFPKSNPFDAAKAELGKHLFFDPRLSSSGSVSCASCHNPSFDWGDGLESRCWRNWRSTAATYTEYSQCGMAIRADVGRTRSDVGTPGDNADDRRARDGNVVGWRDSTPERDQRL